MKFNVYVDEEDVVISITFRCGLAGDYTYDFHHKTDSEAIAWSIAEDIDNQFFEHITKIREAAYIEGWEDKRKHKPPRTRFDWCPNLIKMPAKPRLLETDEREMLNELIM